MKPLIGITVDPSFDAEDPRSRGKLCLNWNYAEQVSLAGGNPILISPLTDVSEIAPMLDGWLIPGGDDIDAKHFGQENHPRASLQDPKRWEVESALYDLIGDSVPIFGICYGSQFLNVKRGGTLIQHVPDVAGHEEHTGGTLQEYAIADGSRLASLSGFRTISGKSYHHQAVDAVGQGLKVSAHASDGIIEAVEDASKEFFVGVQWHPERTPEDAATRNLFSEFVAAAKRFREAR